MVDILRVLILTLLVLSLISPASKLLVTSTSIYEASSLSATNGNATGYSSTYVAINNDDYQSSGPISSAPGEIKILSQEDDPKQISGDYQYVILTDKDFIPYFLNLTLLRAAEGFNVLVVPIESIIVHYAGNTEADKVREFARDIRQRLGAAYLLLGGDVDIIPTAYWYADEVVNVLNENESKATDMYYVYLDGDWDPNSNGKLLEFIDTDGDGVPDQDLEPLPDLTPDLYVGRIPVSSIPALRGVMSIITHYETNPPPGDWAKKAVIAAGIANFDNQDATGRKETDLAAAGEAIVNYVLSPNNYRYTRLYLDEGLETSTFPHELSLNITNVVKAVNEGAGIVFLGGHGNRVEIVSLLWEWDDGDEIPERNEIDSLAFLNKTAELDPNGMYPVYYIMACSDGQYDVTFQSLAEFLVTSSSVGVIAASRVSYYQINWTAPGNYLDQEFAYLFFKELIAESHNRLGEALALSKYAYIQEHGGTYTNFPEKKDLLSYNLLGDPALPAWIDTPRYIEVEHGDIKAGSTLEVSVTDKDEANPINGALIGIYNASDLSLISSATTNSEGKAFITIPSEVTAPDIYLTVWAEGYTKWLEKASILTNATSPIITVTSPIQEHIYGSLVPLNITATDPNGQIINLTISITDDSGGELWSVSMSPGEQTFTFIGNATIEANGKVWLNVMAEDDDGYKTFLRFFIIIDSQPPVLKLYPTSPNYILVAGSIDLTINASDNIPWINITVYVDGDKYYNEVIQASNGWVKLLVSPLPTGDHVIKVVAQDSGGNRAESILNVKSDLQAPEIKVVPDINYGIISPATVPEINITFSDNTGVRNEVVILDGKVIYNGTYIPIIKVNVSELGDGKHELVCSAEDLVGNFMEMRIEFTLDSIPPVLDLKTVPQGNYTNQPSVTLYFNTSDNFGLKRIELFLDNTSIYLNSSLKGIKNFSKSMSVTNLSQGTHQLKVCVTDMSLNRVCQVRNITVDLFPPVIAFPGVANGTLIGPSIGGVPITVNDPSGISRLEAYVNGSIAPVIDGTVVISNMVTGHYIVKVVAEDNAGNSASRAVVVKVDTEKPFITFMNVFNGSHIQPNASITYLVKDNEAIKSVLVMMEDVVISNVSLPPTTKYAGFFNLSRASEGIHEVVARAVDYAGNVRKVSITLLVDSTPPNVEIVNSTNVKVSNPVLYFKTSEDLKELRVVVNGRMFTGEKADGYWIVALEGLRGGENVVHIECKDLAGNTLIKEVVINYQEGLPYIYIIVGGLIVAAIIILLLLYGKKSR